MASVLHDQKIKRKEDRQAGQRSYRGVCEIRTLEYLALNTLLLVLLYPWSRMRGTGTQVEEIGVNSNEGRGEAGRSRAGAGRGTVHGIGGLAIK